MNKNILVVAAHPDDEILGCGGTICRHVQNGDKVHVLILAEGITSRDKIRDQNHRAKDLNLLTETAYQANEILGVTSLIFKKFPDNRLDSIDRIDIIKSIEAGIQKLTPTIIYTHFGGDLNIDHQIVNQSVITACRPQPDSCVKTLLFFEIPSSTEWQIFSSGNAFTPNWFVNISDVFAKKIEALKTYQTEMRPWPHARSIKAVEHLARWRGANVGVDAAEGFMLGRRIN